MRYWVIKEGVIAGLVNWDGVSEHHYGSVELRQAPEGADLPSMLGTPWREEAPRSPEIGRVDQTWGRAFELANPPISPAVPEDDAAPDLIAAADTMPYFAWRALAKSELGDKFPAGKPGKEEIIAALKAA